jgi:hypothetical protein
VRQKVILSPILRDRVKTSCLSRLCNLRKPRDVSPIESVDGCRESLVMETNICHQKDPVSLRNTFLSIKKNMSTALCADSVGSKSSQGFRDVLRDSSWQQEPYPTAAAPQTLCYTGLGSWLMNAPGCYSSGIWGQEGVDPSGSSTL